MIKIHLYSGRIKLINENQVCSIDPIDPVGPVGPTDPVDPTAPGNCRIRMSNGDEFFVVKPSYKQWENDTFVE